MIDGRYSRQELFHKIGIEGQQKLSQKHVLIIGAGALGTGSAEVLARAGVGTITLVDRDYVEFSNLQRQQLFSEEDARQHLPKAVAAKQRLMQINSEVNIRAIVMDVTAQEIEELASGVNVIIDATDNFETRMIINDIAQKRSIPWIYGACVGSYGLTYTFIPGHASPCLNCLLESIPMGGATCDTVGVIASVVQMVNAYQTAEALKILVEDWQALHGKLISFDLWSNQHTAMNVESLKNSACLSCGAQSTYPYLENDSPIRTAVLCGRDTVQIRPSVSMQLNLQDAAASLALQGGKVEVNPYMVSYSTSKHRLAIFQDGRVLVHGTKDSEEAKSLYRRYMGLFSEI